jgi:hypothetical protein
VAISVIVASLRRSSVTNIGSPVILDIDATLVESHSENKAGTAATYKSGFGFHTLLCFADATGETPGEQQQRVEERLVVGPRRRG